MASTTRESTDGPIARPSADVHPLDVGQGGASGSLGRPGSHPLPWWGPGACGSARHLSRRASTPGGRGRNHDDHPGEEASRRSEPAFPRRRSTAALCLRWGQDESTPRRRAAERRTRRSTPLGPCSCRLNGLRNRVPEGANRRRTLRRRRSIWRPRHSGGAVSMGRPTMNTSDIGRYLHGSKTWCPSAVKEDEPRHP